MRSSSATVPPGLRAPLAGALTWLLPGAGHLLIGERVRGTIFLVVIALTFWTGVAVGGVKNTVDLEQRRLWFIGQICAGGHTLALMAWSGQIPDPPPDQKTTRIAYGRVEEISVVYTAICGMLNILILFDVLVRSERREAVPSPAKAAPRVGKGAGP